MSAQLLDISRRRFIAGKSPSEIVTAKPTAAYDAKWGTGFVNGEFFTKLVYKGIG